MSEQDTGHRIIANLDAEMELAFRAACEREGHSQSGPDPRFELPATVLRSISAAATLLRAFARQGDRLWTPAPVDPARLAGVPGLARPVLESGPLERLSRCRVHLAWMETPKVAALREAPRSRAGSPRRDRAPDGGAGAHGWLDDVWKIPPPECGAVTVVSHRRFGQETAEALGCSLPGARVVGSLAELEEHLRRGGADAAEGRRWVVKAPFSAAARSRLRGRPSTLTEPSARRYAERLFSNYGVLLFEPWMPRSADFGYCGLVHGPDQVRLFGPHALEVDSGGHVRGIFMTATETGSIGLSDAELALFARVASEVGKRLGLRGYRGPFGIDGWRYRDTKGSQHFHPLGEINTRLTFGIVARALLERLRSPLGIEANTPARLRLARGEVPATRSCRPVVPLLLPTAEDATSSCLELFRSTQG